MNKDLDRVMADKAMGWEERSVLGQVVYWYDGHNKVYEDAWRPSLRIEQAMECLQEALQSGRVQVYDMIVDTELKVTMVSLYIYKKGKTILIGYGRNSKTTPDALAEAICLALKEVAENEQ